MAIEARGVEHVLPRAQLFEKGRLDGNAVDVHAHRARLLHDVPAEHGRVSGVRREKRSEDADECGLAAAVGPEDAGDASRLDDHAERFERDLVLPHGPPPWRARFALAAPERFLNFVQLDRGCGHDW